MSQSNLFDRLGQAKTDLKPQFPKGVQVSGLPDTQLFYKSKGSIYVIKRGARAQLEIETCLGSSVESLSVDMHVADLIRSGSTQSVFMLARLATVPGMVKLMQVELLGRSKQDSLDFGISRRRAI